MLGDFGFQKFAAMRIEPQQGALRPDLVATTQVYGGGRASVYRGHDVRFGS
jgi:hypothetical protein